MLNDITQRLNDLRDKSGFIHLVHAHKTNKKYSKN